ncbi:MAG: hypothetical protein KDI68_01750 [Gammaproteobacteria bacterium]|nr:hypothetical protein [Gammaproteobacteria bacterium]
MQLPPADLHWFAEQLTETATMILEAWRQREPDTALLLPSSKELQPALERLIGVLEGQHRLENRSSAESASASQSMEIDRLGENGLQMLSALFGLAGELGLDHLNEQLERLALSLALWTARHYGVLDTLELVVNAVARIANDTPESAALKEIFLVMSEILDASATSRPNIAYQDMLDNPRDLLLLNRAIVATRALSPELMELAFTDVAEQLPDAAPGFFREGMAQLQIQNFPADVGSVIERFHGDYPASATIH